MQRSKLFDSFHFLCPQTYKGQDISDCVVLLEYKRPVSNEYSSELLTLSDELYKDYLEYKLPIDTCFTSEAGNLEIQLTFYNVTMDAQGELKQQVRKTSPCIVPIIPIANWASIIPDDALTTIDQRFLALIAASKEQNDLQNAYMKNKADDIVVEDDNTITLLAEGRKIGSTQKLDIENKVIDFATKTSEDTNEDGNFDVVDF